MTRFVKTCSLLCMLTLVLCTAIPSHATPGNQLLRVFSTATETGNCCFSWNETVSVSLGMTPVPVVVTWDADLANGGRFIAGIMVNGGSCISPGGAQIPAGPWTGSSFGPGYQHITFQWIVLPSDGLHSGTNSFTLCGGAYAASNSGGTLSLGYNTLAVRKGP